MGFLSIFLGNGPVVPEIGKIEGGPPPSAQQGTLWYQSLWRTVDIEDICIENPSKT